MATGNPKQVIFYQDQAGNEPVTDWLNRLRDAKTRRRILKRFFRVESGHYGDYKSVGDDVCELRFFFGAGYRVYFGEDGETIVVWHALAQQDAPTVLFFHGNAGEIGDRADRFAAYRAAGFGVMFVSWRG